MQKYHYRSRDCGLVAVVAAAAEAEAAIADVFIIGFVAAVGDSERLTACPFPPYRPSPCPSIGSGLGLLHSAVFSFGIGVDFLH